MTDTPFANARVVGNKSEASPDEENPFAGAKIVGNKALGGSDPTTPTSEPEERSYDTTMWDGMDYKDAMAEYIALKDDPNVSSTVTPSISSGMLTPKATLIYRDPETGENTAIPEPSKDRVSAGGVLRGIGDVIRGEVGLGEALGNAYDRAFTNPKAKVSMGESLMLGSLEAGGDVAETGAAVADKVTDALGYETDLTERVQAGMVSADTSKSAVDSLIADGIPTMALAFTGAATGATAAQMMRWGPTWLRGMATVIGTVGTSEVAATAGTSTDEGTMFIGPDAAFKFGILSQGLDLGDEASDDVLERRAAVFAEGLLAGSIVSGVTTATVWSSKFAGMFFGDFTDLLKKNGPEAKVYRDLSYQLAGVTPDTTAAELAIIRDRIGEIVNDNAVVFNKLVDEGSESAQLKLNTVQSIMRGTDDPKAIADLTRPEYPNFNASQKNVTRGLQTGLDEQAELLGGVGAEAQTRTIGEAANAIADTGRVQVSLADDAVELQEAAYKQMEERFWQDVRDNPEFGDTLKRLQDTVGTEQGQLRRDTGESIQETVKFIYREMTTTKDELYAAVQGGSVDGQKIVDAFTYLNSNAVLPEIDAMNRQPLIKKFVDAIQPLEGEDVADTAKRVKEWIADNDEGLGEYGFMYQKIRPQLSAIANNLFSQTTPGAKTAAGEVRDLVRFIDEDLLDDVSKLDPQLKDGVDAAHSYYKNDYAPFWKKADPKAPTPLSNYAEIYDATLGRGIGEQGFASNAMKGLDSTIREKSVYDVGPLKELLNRPERMGMDAAMRADGDSLTDYYIYDMLENFGAEVQMKGGLDKADLTRLNKIVGSYSDVLTELDDKKAAALNGFIRTVNESTEGLAEQSEMIKRVQETAKKMKQEITGGALKPFFAKEGLGTAENTYGSFQKLFTSPDPKASVVKVRKFISELPPERQKLAEAGLQTAFNRHFREYMFSKTPETGGTLTLSGARAFSSKQEFDTFFGLVDTVFEKTPTVSQTIKEMTVVASELQASRGAKPNSSWSPTEYARSAKEAVSRGIYASVGPLSRPGTRIRSLLSLVIKDKADPRVMSGLMDKMLSDPKYYHELTLKYNKAPRDPRVVSEVSRWLGSTGAKLAGEDTSENPDAVQEEMSGILALGKAAAGKIVGTAVDAVSEEMNQIGVASQEIGKYLQETEQK